METVVISGRIDKQTRDRGNRIIKAAGYTVNDVIKNIWATIVQTGKVPESLSSATEEQKPIDTFWEFEEFVKSIPPAPPELAQMTEAEMKDFLGSRNV